MHLRELDKCDNARVATFPRSPTANYAHSFLAITATTDFTSTVYWTYRGIEKEINYYLRINKIGLFLKVAFYNVITLSRGALLQNDKRGQEILSACQNTSNEVKFTNSGT